VLHCVLQDVLQGGAVCVLLVLQGGLQCVLQDVLQWVQNSVLQGVLQCVLQCVWQGGAAQGVAGCVAGCVARWWCLCVAGVAVCVECSVLQCVLQDA